LLRAIVEDKIPIDKIVDSILNQSKDSMIAALRGVPESHKEVDRNTFIITAHIAFEELFKSKTEKSRVEETVIERISTIDRRELQKAVAQLVELNLLSYEDDITVSFHTRKLKWVYERVRD